MPAAITPAMLSDRFSGRYFGSILGIGLFAAALGSALAADWQPDQPITIIVPWAAGGSTDQVTRVVAGELEIRNRFIQRTFGRYLSDEVVASLLETPEGLALGGEKREVTLLFADLRGFTSISAHHPAATVLKLVNRCLITMSEVVFRATPAHPAPPAGQPCRRRSSGSSRGPAAPPSRAGRA